MTITRTALLDCDGVIVDNGLFEDMVTKTLIGEISRRHDTTIDVARETWNHELQRTRSDWRWYDYKFHAVNLGLDRSQVEDAHREAAHLLCLVDGVDDTIRGLIEHGLAVSVVTDATDWVAKFKLSVVNASINGQIFSSDGVGATKRQPRYWQKVQAALGRVELWLLVDNRTDNLLTAASAVSLSHTVLFDQLEHIMRMPRELSPLTASEVDRESLVVPDHISLQVLLEQIYGGTKL